MPKRKIPKIKKNIASFLNNEEGKITKKDALKLGTTTILVGFLIKQATDSEAQCWPAASHTSDFHNSGCPDACPDCPSNFADCPSYTPCDCPGNVACPTNYLGDLNSDYPGYDATDFGSYDSPHFGGYCGTVMGDCGSECNNEDISYNITDGCETHFSTNDETNYGSVLSGDGACPKDCGGHICGVHFITVNSGDDASAYPSNCILDFSSNDSSVCGSDNASYDGGFCGSDFADCPSNYGSNYPSDDASNWPSYNGSYWPLDCPANLSGNQSDCPSYCDDCPGDFGSYNSPYFSTYKVSECPFDCPII